MGNTHVKKERTRLIYMYIIQAYNLNTPNFLDLFAKYIYYLTQYLSTNN
jgi:hypothetical protein